MTPKLLFDRPPVAFAIAGGPGARSGRCPQVLAMIRAVGPRRRQLGLHCLIIQHQETGLAGWPRAD